LANATSAAIPTHLVGRSSLRVVQRHKDRYADATLDELQLPVSGHRCISDARYGRHAGRCVLRLDADRFLDFKAAGARIFARMVGLP